MNNDGFLCCEVKIEWTNKQGIVERRLTNKRANLRLIRDGTRDLFIQISAEKMVSVKFRLKSINVHNKFMNEGKATIRFMDENAILYLSNAPTGQLIPFLKTIFIKMVGKKTTDLNTSLRSQILNGKLNQVDEISPVTNLEYENAIKKVGSKATATTPSPSAIRKRKLEGPVREKKSAKRLYTETPTTPSIELNSEQQEIMNACLAGQNVFFTGSAGTGKSYLLKKIIAALPPDVTVATASTGVAACHIGGITLHQFAGVGTGDATLNRCIELASKTPNVTIWRKCRHLIVDEVSMVEGEYFEKLEQVARKVRKNDKPFGGIQLILCGDFFQLPPVTKKPTDPKTPFRRFCFQTTAWKECHLNTFELKTIHRQTDEKFIRVLNKIRLGKVDDDVTTTLLATSKQKIETDGILATRLCTHTADADIINQSQLTALQGEVKLYDAHDLIPGSTKQLNQQTSVPEKLELKIGAQVMLLKNINVSTGLVNGARGVIKDFQNGLPVVQFRNKKEYVAQQEKWIIKTAGGASITRKQIPLKLAWAFSIHKAQGLTLDCVEMSLGRVFEAGQAYVALSRAQSLETLRVLDFKSTQVWANPDVLTFYKTLDQIRIIPLKPINRLINTKSELEKKGWKSKSKLYLNKPLVNIC